MKYKRANCVYCDKSFKCNQDKPRKGDSSWWKVLFFIFGKSNCREVFDPFVVCKLKRERRKTKLVYWRWK